MKKNKNLTRFGLTALLTVSLGYSAYAQLPATAKIPAIPFEKIAILTTQLTPHFYVMRGSPNLDPGHPEGAGGYTGVFTGPEGVLLVDCSYAPLADKISFAIRRVSSAPIRFLVDTHEHPDHTGGNPTFAKMGALIFAREETREALAQPFPVAVKAAFGNAASDTDPARLPVVTYGGTGTVKIYLNGETIDLIPVLQAHTNGDTMVKFEQEDVIMIGDFYRNYGYPFVDAGHGGTFKGIIAALDTLMKLSGPNTQLVPGHGTIINHSALIPYRDMILDIEAKVEQLIAAGKTKEEVLAAKLTAPYDARVKGGTDPLPAGLGTSADRFVGALYTELKTTK